MVKTSSTALDETFLGAGRGGLMENFIPKGEILEELWEAESRVITTGNVQPQEYAAGLTAGSQSIQNWGVRLKEVYSKTEKKGSHNKNTYGNNAFQ